MSRLDRHIAAVRNKLALDRFISALAWAGVVYVALLWAGVIVDRMLRVRPPHLGIWLLGAGGAAVLYALIVAIIKRPTSIEAAVAIDERLALKEKFSTALYARPLNDPFARAAVKDAEETAQTVSLNRRFPLRFPRQSIGAFAIAILVALTMAFLPPMDLFGKEAQRHAKAAEQLQADAARQSAQKALQVIVQAEAKGTADDQTMREDKRELQELINGSMRDPDKAKRSAARALSDLDQAIKQQIAGNQRVSDADNDSKAFKSLTPPSDEKGPVADAQRKIAKGDFSGAVDNLKEAVEKFDKMSDDDKKKAAQQMQQMAQQLAQMGNNNPQQQQQQQQQLQQMGLNQQQAKQAQQLMQQAVQGDKQAQQQLQQMASQAMKQMNNGQGPNQQQRQQMNQMMQKMQSQMNTQMQAQQMAQAAKQMAQAMKQSQQQGGQGQQSAQQASQQMAQGKAQMQQQLQAMQAMKADAQQAAAQQAAAAQAMQQALNGLNGGNQNGGQQANNGQGQWQGNNNGQWNHNNNRQFKGPNNGMGGGGIGAGDRSQKEQAPYAVKQEISESKDIEGGKILASTLIKSKNIRGESHVGATDVAPPPAQEATDEVEQDRISLPAQETVKEYFSAWQKDAQKQ